MDIQGLSYKYQRCFLLMVRGECNFYGPDWRRGYHESWENRLREFKCVDCPRSKNVYRVKMQRITKQRCAIKICINLKNAMGMLLCDDLSWTVVIFGDRSKSLRHKATNLEFSSTVQRPKDTFLSGTTSRLLDQKRSTWTNQKWSQCLLSSSTHKVWSTRSLCTLETPWPPWQRSIVVESDFENLQLNIHVFLEISFYDCNLDDCWTKPVELERFLWPGWMRTSRLRISVPTEFFKSLFESSRIFAHIVSSIWLKIGSIIEREHVGNRVLLREGHTLKISNSTYVYLQ